MNKKLCFALLLLSITFQIKAQKGQVFKGYRFTIDLQHISNDQVRVELVTPAITRNSITYHFPKMVPGTYSVDDYGRYIEDFTAFDRNGKRLEVIRIDTNSWKISHADKLYKISYLVNDTYDDYDTKQIVFEPAGSDIQKDTVYAINNHCFLGYFDDMKNLPYELSIIHPANMYGSTAMIDQDRSNIRDKFVTESYNRIVDNPILYDIPDTTVIKVGKASILISVYSPHKLVTSKFLAEKLDTLLMAQTKYLGGQLPVDKYAFIIFLNDTSGPSQHEGALEHSYSSFYYYGERGADRFAGQFVDNAAHEFFHIITPLSIHSEEIQNFDFEHPKMSRHLWLYEGSTEYHAHMVQEKYGMITPEELLNVFSQMITVSRTQFNDTVPFTVMSSGALGQYKDEYENVYQKGALIALCIDIRLLQLSKGKYGFINLIRDLSLKYGKQRGFKDEELFSEIEKLTYPEIGTFLKTYVSGNQPLPLEDIFNTVGVRFRPVVQTGDSVFSLGHAGFSFDPGTKRIFISDVSNLNAMGKTLGYHKNDQLISLNGQEINLQSARKIFGHFGDSSKSGDELVIRVSRKTAGDADTTIDLKAPMTKLPVFKYNLLDFIKDPTPDELMIRNYWLKPNGIQSN